MTLNKDGLEAALLPCPLCNAQMEMAQWHDWEGQPLTNRHISHQKSLCPLAEIQIEATPDAIVAWNRRALDRASFDAGWEKAKLLLKPEDLSTALSDHIADAGRMVS